MMTASGCSDGWIAKPEETHIFLSRWVGNLLIDPSPKLPGSKSSDCGPEV